MISESYFSASGRRQFGDEYLVNVQSLLTKLK